jgi:hypothetical protein
MPLDVTELKQGQTLAGMGRDDDIPAPEPYHWRGSRGDDRGEGAEVLVGGGGRRAGWVGGHGRGGGREPRDSGSLLLYCVVLTPFVERLTMFSGAKQKIERAEHHMSDLAEQFRAFVARRPHRFFIQPDAEVGTMSIGVRFLEKPPSTLPLMIGDAIHNLRSALDHAAWELVGMDGGKQDRHLRFPTGDDRVSFEASCSGVRTPSQWVKDAIKSTEAFAGGAGDDLYQLNRLDNTDKHRAIVSTVRATGHPPFKITSPDGRVMTRFKGNVFVGEAPEFVQFGRVGPGLMVELEDDAECPPDIFLAEPKVTSAMSVVPLLRRFSQSVRRALCLMEARPPA